MKNQEPVTGPGVYEIYDLVEKCLSAIQECHNLLMTQVGEDLYKVEEKPWCLIPGAHRGDVRLRKSELG